jgi:hypothetical protein
MLEEDTVDVQATACTTDSCNEDTVPCRNELDSRAVDQATKEIGSLSMGQEGRMETHPSEAVEDTTMEGLDEVATKGPTTVNKVLVGSKAVEAMAGETPTIKESHKPNEEMHLVLSQEQDRRSRKLICTKRKKEEDTMSKRTRMKKNIRTKMDKMRIMVDTRRNMSRSQTTIRRKPTCSTCTRP